VGRQEVAPLKIDGVKKKRSWHVLVVELDEDARELPEAKMLNSAADPGKPSVYVSRLARSAYERVLEGDFERAEPVVKKLGRAVLPGRRSRHTKFEGALSRQERMVDSLRQEGWTVLNAGSKERTYSVYVVELKPAAITARVLKRNPGYEDDMPCVYVGQTGQSPEERFADHERGGFTASRRVEKHGVRLLPELYGRLNPMTQLESLRAERNLTTQLRKHGYAVEGGT